MGGILGGGGGSSGGSTTSTVTQRADPWAGLQPYLKGTGAAAGAGLFPEAAAWYKGPSPQFYPNSTVAGLAPETETAWDAMAMRGLTGSPINTMGSNYAQDVLAGNWANQFLGGPQGDALFNNIESRVRPAVDSRFAQAGRYGSGAYADASTRALTEAYAPFAQQAYENERSRMQDVLRLAPTLAQEDYRDIAALGAVGQERQARAQELLNADIARYQFGQDLPLFKLAQYSGLLQNPAANAAGGSSSQTTGTQNLPSNAFGNLLGLGSLGLGAYGLFGPTSALAAGAAPIAATSLLSNPFTALSFL